MNEEQTVEQQAQPQPQAQSRPYGLKKFKMMSNIVQGAMHQTRYMKSLEKITMDAQVAYNRMFIAMGIAALSTILYFQLTFSGGKMGYVFIPATLTLIGIFILVINFLVSSRTKSMLTSAGKLAFHPFIESTRRRTKTAGDLKSLGIKSFDKGVLKFQNGDYGLIYKIDGALSLSALPSTANMVSDAKASYLVARPASCQESMIVSVVENTTKDQQQNLQSYIDRANSGSMGDLWIQAMAKKTQELIKSRIDGEYTVIEHVILRDEDIKSLRKSADNLERSVTIGLYARVDRLTDKDEVVKVLAPLALLSKKGMKQYGK